MDPGHREQNTSRPEIRNNHVNEDQLGITSIALFGTGFMYWTRGAAIPEGEHVFRSVQRIISRNMELPGLEKVAISETVALNQGQTLEISEYPIGEINIQKLTDNNYWIPHNVHAMTLYVGETEALLVDAVESLFVDRLLSRIAKITPTR